MTTPETEEREKVEAATVWRKFADERPVSGSKIVALWDDGSGAAMLFVHDGGVIDQDGDDYDKISSSHVFWTYLPSGFEFWCENYPEDPVTLPDHVSPDDTLLASHASMAEEIRAFGDLQNEHANLMEASRRQDEEIERLSALINTPEIVDFIGGVHLEAVHQRERWGSDHDAGKAPLDWFWLIGYLAQKAATAQIAGDTDKALHHTISTAAALANWHAAISGTNTSMRPGIEPPAPNMAEALRPFAEVSGIPAWANDEKVWLQADGQSLGFIRMGAFRDALIALVKAGTTQGEPS